ncbi:MAG TPA: hypothetical protein VIJ51_03545 [Solirubrobacteraceae bacterium]
MEPAEGHHPTMDAGEQSMLRERDSRVAAQGDVLATLAELDEKLEALERGMAAAEGTAVRGPARDDRPGAFQGQLADAHAVADFQAAARSRTERRLWRQAIPETSYPAGPELEPGPAELPAEPAVAPVWAAGEVDVEPVAGGPDAAPPVGPQHGPNTETAGSWAPAAPVMPAGAPSRPAPRSPEIAAAIEDLAGWRERLRRAIHELTTLQVEIEMAAVHAAEVGGASTSPSGVHATPLTGPPPPPAPRYGPANDQRTGGPGPLTGDWAPADPTDDSASTPDNVYPAAGVRLPVPMPHDRIFEGRVLVDAGPFLDIAGVTAFQHALELVPGARAVDVTALDLDRAHLELELTDPVALGREIRAAFPFHFAIFEAGHGRLSINVDASSLSAPQRAPATR